MRLPPDPRGKHPDVFRADPGAPVPLAADITLIGPAGPWWRWAGLEADPINPEYVAAAPDPTLPDDAIATSDSGSTANWYARHPTMRPGMRARCPARWPPRSAGAVRDRREVLPPGPARDRLVGDGAMQMNGLAEMITAAKYRDLWEDPRLIVAVWNNRDLDQVTWEQMEATAASILKGDADRVHGSSRGSRRRCGSLCRGGRRGDRGSGGHPLRGWLKRSMLPEGSRKAQSRTP
ncbi:hypothetical protein GCM10023323_37740 [Streptomyces thinghirensis]|uniref:Uncharacterized protein n=1 Tax=Streptomyces thinghirensis TaxID=551547 RepID=A0ABP9T823_9ACTN